MLLRRAASVCEMCRTDDPALQAAIYRVLSKLRDCEDIAKNLERQAREGQVSTAAAGGNHEGSRNACLPAFVSAQTPCVHATCKPFPA